MNALSLAHVAMLLGAVAIAASLWQIIAPAQVRRMLDAFPRSTAAAWTLTAIDLLWVAWLLYHTSLGRFDYLKPSLYFITPLSFFLLINYLDELLAARALGGLLLLLPHPVLQIAQWHDSEWRLVIVVLAYLWVVAGMALVLSPYLFRRAVLKLVPNDACARGSAAIKMVAGIGLVVLGLTVY